jgi:predicted transcriptional regulator
VNVIIAAVLCVWLLVIGGWRPLSQLTVGGGSFVERLMLVNLFLVGFNLLPAFPMDGGRVLRALLAMRMDYARATQRAAGIGQMMAFVFGFFGLFGNPFLLFIAFFVWIGAAQEANMVQAKSALADVTVESAMQTNFQVLSSADTLSRAIELILSGPQQDFPVVWGDEVIGVLTRAQLMVALAKQGEDARVAEVMTREFCQAITTDMLEPQLMKLSQGDCRTMPVLRNGRLVGLLTMENVGEYVMIQSALHSKTQQRQDGRFTPGTGA